MLKKTIMILAVCFLVFIVSFSGFGCFEGEKEAVEIVEEEPDMIEEIIGGMSLRQKICQLIVVGLNESSVDQALRERWRNYPFGGVILFERNVIKETWLSEFVDELQDLSDPNRSLFVCIDEEGGSVSRIRGESFPSAAGMAKLSEEEVNLIGRKMAEKLSSYGINMNLSPVLDVNLDARNTVIGNRSFGSDPELVASYGIALFSGLIDNGIIPVGKHFPGHGSTLVDSHYVLPVLHKNRDQLFELELIPFREAIRAGIPVIMTAHLVVDGVDRSPATMSPLLIDLLRTDLFFDGVIISDDLEMAALTDNYSWEEIVLETFLAGVDLLLIGQSSDLQEEAVHILEKAYAEGVISDDRLNSSLHRILLLKQSFNLLPSAN